MKLGVAAKSHSLQTNISYEIFFPTCYFKGLTDTIVTEDPFSFKCWPERQQKLNVPVRTVNPVSVQFSFFEGLGQTNCFSKRCAILSIHFKLLNSI